MSDKLKEMYSNFGKIELTIITLKDQLKYYTDLKNQMILQINNEENAKDLHTENGNGEMVDEHIK